MSEHIKTHAVKKKGTKTDSSSLNASKASVQSSKPGGHKNSGTRVGVSSSKRNFSSSRHSADAAPVRVLDEDGHDITPVSLLATSKAQAGGGAHRSRRDGGEKSSMSSSRSGLISPTSGSERMSQSGDHAASSGLSDSGWSASEDEAVSSPKLGSESGAESGDERAVVEKKQADKKQVPTEVPVEVVTEEMLNQVVRLDLVETDTVFLLQIPGTCVQNDTPDHAVVSALNQKYQQLCKDKVGNDRFMARGMNTVNPATKTKEIQAVPPVVASTGVQASGWDIHDSMNPVEEDGKGDQAVLARIGDKKKKDKASDAADAEMDWTPFLPNILNSMHLLERMVAQNNYHKKHLVYRELSTVDEAMGLPPPPPPAPGVYVPPKRSLDLLWSFNSPLTKGRNIACMSWNKMQTDLLAVAYGQFEFTKQTDGMILFWSLKNPQAPERVYHAACGVTSLSFSTLHPNLLAAGWYNGTVAVYDLRSDSDKPVLESAHNSGKHLDAVWEVAWVDKGSEKGEVLVSVSTDGRVTQWSIKKGLEFVDLMKLKRVSGHENKSEAFISRLASGLCFDFSSKDPNIYLAGTEEGNIHKCSCSYNEQYLETYFGHAGPVYRIRWAPFWNQAFLTCSADWTVKLWNHEHVEPIFTLGSFQDDVTDICWSPNVSTMFGSVTADGRIDIWDLNISTLDPVVSARINPRKPSCILFGLMSSVVLTGDNDGNVDVYRLTGMEYDADIMPDEQQKKLEAAMQPSDAASFQ